MKKTNQGFIVPLLIIIIVALVVGGGFYVYSHKNKVSEIKETGSQTASTSTTPQEKIIKEKGVTYINSDYGFSLSLPPAWVGYRAERSQFTIKFGIKDQNDIFTISILTKAQYAEYLKDALQDGRLLGQNQSYVFLGGAAQDSAEIAYPYYLDVGPILDTFKLVK